MSVKENWTRKSERIKSQRLPHSAQITTFLLSLACQGREAPLERRSGRCEEQTGGGERERERERSVSGQNSRRRKMESDIKRAGKSVISCKGRLQGENKMRKAHFNLQSFGSETKQKDHTTLTTFPKLQFTFHFLNTYTHHTFRRIQVIFT